MRRRKSTIFFLVLGICLITLAVALNVSWILLNLEKVVLLVLGIIFFAIIITGLVLNTIFLLREIKRNEQQDAFLNSVTHELKTPIASIRLYLETLKTRDVKEEKKQEFYNIMLKDSDRLLNTVEQVLHASRSRDEKKLTNAVTIDLTKLLDDSIEQIRSRYNFDEGIIIFDKSNAFNVTGNYGELQTVFTNLLDNAVKYSDKDVKIIVSLKDFDEKFADIRIKDNGVGIAKTQLKRIFNRFYRIPSLSTQKAKGTGLGLFIVKSMVKKHGGKISVESEGEGFGTTFCVQLPKK
jgi:two-component system, OmpR family, sensor histidine kinase SenX3